MTIFVQNGATTAISLNGDTSASGVLNPAGDGAQAYAVLNADDEVAFIKFGSGSAPTATAADFPLPPGISLGIDPGIGITHAAVIGQSEAAGIIYITPIHADSRR